VVPDGLGHYPSEGKTTGQDQRYVVPVQPDTQHLGHRTCKLEVRLLKHVFADVQLPCPAAAGSRSCYKLLQDPRQSSQYLASGERKSFFGPSQHPNEGGQLTGQNLIS
jgi:hypothetical protein